MRNSFRLLTPVRPFPPGERHLGYFTGDLLSISLRISSAQRIASAIALIVAGTRFSVVLSQFPRCKVP